MPEWLDERIGDKVEDQEEQEQLKARVSNSGAVEEKSFSSLSSNFVMASKRKKYQLLSLLRPDNSPPKKGANHARSRQ